MNIQQKSEVLSALANPLRLRILGVLTENESLSINEISERLSITGNQRSNVGASIKLLYNNKLLTMNGEGRNNKTYSLKNKEKISEFINSLQSLIS